MCLLSTSLLITSVFAQASGAHPSERLVFAQRSVTVVGLPAAKERAAEGSVSLYLPRKGPNHFTSAVLVNGWFFWHEGVADGEQLSQWPEGAWMHWCAGHAVQLHATHVRTGASRTWALPGRSDERALELRREEERLEDPDFEGPWPALHGVTSSPRIVALPGGDGFLVQEAENGDRTTLRLGLDGAVEPAPEFTAGILWHPLPKVQPVEEESPSSPQSWGGIDFSGTWGLGGKTPQRVNRFEGLGPPPNWSQEVIGARDFAEHLSGTLIGSDGRWFGVAHAWCATRDEDGPGSVGYPEPPFQDALVEVDGRTGRVLRREVIGKDHPFGRARDEFGCELWLAGGALVSRIDSGEPADDPTAWRFAVARAASNLPDDGWRVRTVEIEGLPRTREPALLGELEDGVALYRTWEDDDDSAAVYVVVDGRSMGH